MAPSVTDDPPLPPAPRQARGALARSSVYDAALRRFARHGVAATRIEDVVADAGVAWGTFYRWFPRKQDVLLEAAVRHLRERVTPAVDRGLDDPTRPARDVALELFTTLLDPGEHPVSLFGEILGEVMVSRARFAGMYGEDPQPIMALIARVIAHGQQRAEVRSDVDPFTLSVTLFAGAAFPVVYGYYGAFRGIPDARPAGDLGALIDRFFGVAWRGIERAPAAIPAPDHAGS
jgi:AcrR family transcriptional regulator